MAQLIAQNLAPIMFAALVVFLLLGYPVAFALAANGLLFFVIAVELAPRAPDVIRLDWPLLQALPERIYQTMGNEVLLAVPFFTFMGLVLELSGMAEDLLDTIGQLFGPVRGGLAYAVIFVGALLAATTGVVAASGTLAQIIPPSLVLIVMADQLGRSVGDMYAGALVPGLVLSALYAGYVLLMTLIYPNRAPALPIEARTLGSGVISLVVAMAIAIAVGAVTYVHFTGDPQWRTVTAFFAAVTTAFAMAMANLWFDLNLLSRLASQVIIVLIPP